MIKDTDMAKNTTKKTSKKPSAKPVPKASRAPVWEVLAGMLLAALTAAGIVSRQDGAKAREVFVKDFAELEPIIQSFKE